MTDDYRDEHRAGAPDTGNGPRIEESAFWTLIDAAGQIVLAGWCLSTSVLTVTFGFDQAKEIARGEWLPAGDPTQAAAVALVAMLVGVGALLLWIGGRFMRRGLCALRLAVRKMLFGLWYRRNTDFARVALAVEGDPILEPYLRYLVKREFRAVSGRKAQRDRPPVA